MDRWRLHPEAADRASGAFCDQRVGLKGYYPARQYSGHVRRIRLKDPESAETLVSLTNNSALPAPTIAAAVFKSCRVAQGAATLAAAAAADARISGRVAAVAAPRTRETRE